MKLATWNVNSLGVRLPQLLDWLETHTFPAEARLAEPAAAEAAAICERMRELGVIVLTTSERSNVLKIKPPLCLTAHSADHVVAMLDRVLTEGW